MRIAPSARLARLFPVLILVPWPLLAQGTVEDYERARTVNERLGELIVGQPSSPTWLGESDRFWYRVSTTGGNEWRLGSREAEVAQNGVDGFVRADEGEDPHVGAAVGAEQGEDLEDACEEAGPAGAGGGGLWRVGRFGSGRFDLGSAGDAGQAVVVRAGVGVGRPLAVVATEGDDAFA